MKHSLLIRTATAAITLLVCVYPLASGETEGVGQLPSVDKAYLFLGVDVMAESGSRYYPVSTVRKRHLYIDLGDTEKRLPIRTPCVLRTKWEITQNFAEILEMQTDMEMSQDTTELDAMADMLRAERRSAMMASDARNAGDSRRAQAIEERNKDYQTSVQDLIDRGELVDSAKVDTITIDASILPQADATNAYMVACVTYDIEDPDTGEIRGRGGQAKANYLGDLAKGKVRELKFRTGVDAFKLAGAEVTLHLYSGSGEPIALSNSPKLRELTPEQVQKLRENAANR
jgi:hypothetical protein